MFLTLLKLKGLNKDIKSGVLNLQMLKRLIKIRICQNTTFVHLLNIQNINAYAIFPEIILQEVLFTYEEP